MAPDFTSNYMSSGTSSTNPWIVDSTSTATTTLDITTIDDYLTSAGTWIYRCTDPALLEEVRKLKDLNKKLTRQLKEKQLAITLLERKIQKLRPNSTIGIIL